MGWACEFIVKCLLSIVKTLDPKASSSLETAVSSMENCTESFHSPREHFIEPAWANGFASHLGSMVSHPHWQGTFKTMSQKALHRHPDTLKALQNKFTSASDTYSLDQW